MSQQRFWIPNTNLFAAEIHATMPQLWAPHGDWEVSAATPMLIPFWMTPGNSIGSPVAPGTGVAGQDRFRFAFGIRLAGSGTMRGTIKGQMAFRQINAAVDGRVQALARIVNSDGSVERGVVLPHDTAGLSSEFLTNSGGGASAVFRNRNVPRGGAQALAAVGWLHGDYLIFELGHRNHGTNTSNVGYHVGGETGGGDLPEDETTDLTGASGESGDHAAAWIEFSEPPPLHADWIARHPAVNHQNPGIL